MASSKAGTIWAELSLDDKVYKQKLSENLNGAQATAKGIEASWRALGEKSDAYYEAQRRSAENAYTLIKNSALSTSNDIVRAERAKNERIKELDEKQYGSSVLSINNLKKHWLAATAAIGAAMGTLYQGWGLAEQAAGYLEQMQLLDGLAQKYNTSASSIVGSIKNVSDGMVSLKTAAEVSTSALAKGLSAEQIINLSQAAVTLSDVMGTTANEAFVRLSSAMETGKEKSIKLAVGVIDLKEKYGIAVDTMTEVQKRQALYNIVMEKTAEIQGRTGAAVKSVSDEMETFKVTIEDVKLELGVGLVKAGAAAIGVFQWMAAGVLAVASAVPKAIEYVSLLSAKFYELTGQTERAKTAREEAASWSQTYNNMQGAAEELAGKAAEKFALLTATTEQLTTAQNKNAAASKLMSDEATGRYEREKKAAEANKAIEESIRKSQISVDQIRQTTYEKELVRIASEKAEWEKKGADKILIAKWEELEITEAKYKASLERAKNDIEAGTKAVEEENKLRIEGWKALAEKYKEINAAMTEDEKYQLEQRLNQYKEAWDNMISIANLNSGNLSLGMSQYMTGFKGLSDISTGQDQYSKEIDAALEHYQTMEEKYMFHKSRMTDLASAANQAILDGDVNKYNSLMDLHSQYEADYENLTRAAANRDLIIQYATQKQKISSQLMYAQVAMGALSAVSEFTDKENKAMFIAMKAVSIAMAIIQGHLAAMGAAAAVANIPYVGPALAMEQYSQWMAMTYINAGLMAAVAIGQLAGLGSSSASVPTSSYVASSTGYSYNSETQTTNKKEEERPISITVHVLTEGVIQDIDSFSRSLVGPLAKAVRDGSH